MSEMAFQMAGVRRRLGDFQLQVDHLSLERGCVMGLVGRNGSGKTTTIGVLLNLIYPDEGDVVVLGQAMPQAEREVKRHIGYVSESPGFYDDTTVRWTLDLVRPHYPRWDDDLMRRYLDLFELDPRRKIKQLSKGQRARLALTLALSSRPQLLLLDEPTSGLDPVMRLELLEQIAEVIREEECSVVLSSHQTQDVERIADYVAIIAEGRVQEIDDTISMRERWQRVTGVLPDGGVRGIEPLFRSLEHDGSRFTGVTDRWGADWRQQLTATGVTEHESHRLGLDEILIALSPKLRR